MRYQKSMPASKKAGIIVQIIIAVGIAALALFILKSQSIGTLVIRNTTSQKITGLILHAVNPTTHSIVDTIPVPNIEPHTETELSLESVQWQKITLELCHTPSRPVAIGSQSDTILVLPGGKALKVELTGSSMNRLQISGWQME